MQVKRIGSRNCVNCDHYLKCKDDRKSIIFVCERHRKTDSGHAFEAMFMSDTLGEDIRPRNDLVLPSAAHSDPYADMGGFDAFEALKSVVNDKRIVSPDIKIPEDDFPEAPNFYKYCVSDQYLDQKPFLEQALMGVELFAEYCPRCTDMEWFDHTHRVNDSLTTFERKVALFEHGKCPHCGMTRLQAFKKKLMHPYYELAACCGQRAGKSAWFGMAGTYLTHRVIKLGRPNEVYKLLKANVLQGTMVALTYAQAKDTLWEPFYGNLVDGPWWQRYHAMLDDVGSRYGEELYTLKDTFVNYRHRRVYAYPAGPDKRVLRGRTRFLCLRGSSFVSTSKGLIQIKNDLTGLRTNKGDSRFRVSDWAPTGVKAVFRLVLSNGQTLDATGNHEVQTTNGWKRLDHVSSDDCVNVSLGGEFPEILPLTRRLFLENYRSPTQMTPGLGKLIGVLLSSCTTNNHAYKCCSDYLGITLSQTNSVQVKEFFQYLGLTDIAPRKKSIPWSILEADKHSAAAFLSSLFFCNGKVVGEKVYYVYASKNFIRELQLLLTRFGVLSYAQRVAKGYRLLVRGEYQVLFMEALGMIPTLRRETTERVPMPDRGIVPVRVRSVKPLKAVRVYDLTVDDDEHAFTANGIVVHNCAIDELGWFPNDVSAQQNVKMNANEVYVALENSLGTVRQSAKNAIKQGFYNVPFGYFMNISSPSSMRDKIMELVRKSQHSRVIMGIQKATWEMNPTLPRKSDFLKEKFRADPVGAMRDFGAQPPITNSPFIANADYVEQCFSDKKNNIQVSYHVKKSKRGDQQEIYGQVDRIGKSGRRSVLAIDGGYSNNSFAVAVGHLNSHGTPVISLVAEIIPEMGIPIQYSLSYTCFLLPIIASRNVIFATADRWNSLKILSDMETELGLGKQQYSLKYADMQMFKSYLCDGQLLLPKPTMSVKDILAYDHSNYPNCFKHLPADHLVLQCLTVQDTGSQVLKGDSLTDDILRATMLCTTMLLDETKREELMGPDKAIEAAVDVKQLMFSRGYSTGSTGQSMGDGGASAVGILRSRT